MLLACKVFASRQAIAIGPTPSGTGVIARERPDRVEVDVADEAFVEAVDADVDQPGDVPARIDQRDERAAVEPGRQRQLQQDPRRPRRRR
jgi:hypothetical protein